MDRVESESFRLLCPAFADELVGCEAPEGLQPSAEGVSRDEVGQVLAELIVVVVMEALDGRLLDRPVHPLDLTVRPGVLHLGEPVLDAVFATDAVEDVFEGIAVTRPIGELDAVIGQWMA
jgi:hypothetical protein